ncbi:MAG: ABC transporter, substrate-binding protein (cluster 7, di-/tri-carboxylate), partial [uncultured Ramlibacter sp.]
RRHAAGPAAADHAARRLHARADPAGRLPPAVHDQDQLGPGQGHRVHPQRHRLCVRHRGADRQPDQDLGRLRGVRQGESRQAELRLHRHADQPAPDHRADRAEAGPAAEPHPLQGQRRAGGGDHRRSHHGRGGFHRLRAAGAVWQAAGAEHLGREAPGEIPGRADPQGARPGHRAELTVRHRRTARHAAGHRRQAARGLQEGDGGAQLRAGPGPLRHGADVHEPDPVHQVRPGHLRHREGAGGEAGAGQAEL